jgi:histidinol-phosphate phosphatase family protein
MTPALRPAVFLDKDGTLVHDVPFNVDPDRLRLREGAGRALASLARAGYALVLVTNQSGIALGRFAPAALGAVWQRLDRLLAPHAVRLDAIYHCPHHVDGTVVALARDCSCRKPRPGMLLRAARDLDLDLARSWMVGDILDDIEAGRRAGCRTVLLDVGSETEWRRGPLRVPDAVAGSLPEMADIVLGQGSEAPVFGGNAHDRGERQGVRPPATGRPSQAGRCA